jgi:hypothetical protein
MHASMPARGRHRKDGSSCRGYSSTSTS